MFSALWLSRGTFLSLYGRVVSRFQLTFNFEIHTTGVPHFASMRPPQQLCDRVLFLSKQSCFPLWHACLWPLLDLLNSFLTIGFSISDVAFAPVYHIAWAISWVFITFVRNVKIISVRGRVELDTRQNGSLVYCYSILYVTRHSVTLWGVVDISLLVAYYFKRQKLFDEIVTGRTKNIIYTYICMYVYDAYSLRDVMNATCNVW